MIASKIIFIKSTIAFIIKLLLYVSIKRFLIGGIHHKITQTTIIITIAINTLNIFFKVNGSSTLYPFFLKYSLYALL